MLDVVVVLRFVRSQHYCNVALLDVVVVVIRFVKSQHYRNIVVECHFVRSEHNSKVILPDVLLLLNSVLLGVSTTVMLFCLMVSLRKQKTVSLLSCDFHTTNTVRFTLLNKQIKYC